MDLVFHSRPIISPARKGSPTPPRESARRVPHGWLRVAAALAAAAIVVAAGDAALFRTPAYHAILAPASSAGSFEATVARLRAYAADPARDVVVLGDSRIFEGLMPPVAAADARGLRFVSAAIPGTTPRCWPFLLRAIDPDARRFRALVIPVDTYADDDSAIGSADMNDRPFDLHYVVYQIGLADAWPLAATFSDPREKLGATLDLWLRAPLLREDVQSLVADPQARVAALARERAGLAPLGTLAAQARTLHGLRADFARGVLNFPPGIDSAERRALERQVLPVIEPSPQYAAYRREWLGAIVDRYVAAGTSVVFVRIPTRPLHRTPAGGPSGTLIEFARAGARLVPQAPYVALERPELFADHDHLNVAGATQFSRMLGRDVAAALARPPAVPVAAPAPSAPPAPVARPSLWDYAGARAPIEFQSYEYAIFLALAIAIFYALPRRAGWVFLLIASWYFYARWNAWYLVFLLALTASDFWIALALERARAPRRKLLLGAGVAANVAFLGTMKYANFTGATLGGILGAGHPLWLVDWLVPVGISFHTFQSISYLVDVYRGEQRAIHKPLDYALYIAFFPQLLSGPIVRAKRFFGELYQWKAPDADAVMRGVGEIALGLFKKTAIADQLATVADAYFRAPAEHLGAPWAWSGIVAFAFQIYFDFSGYTDIALGSARLLGFDFPPNFHRPYLATSIREFWHRWHMSLSTWLRDYVYIPLGGSHGSAAATARNLMLTMLVGGLWHGASWTFVAWGAYHGVLLIAERWFGLGRDATPRGAAWLGRVLLTFALVTFGWILFRAQSFPDALVVAHAALFGGPGPWAIPAWTLGLVALSGLVAFAQERGWSPAPIVHRPLAYGGALAAGLFALQLLSWSGEATPFIYFNF